MRSEQSGLAHNDQFSLGQFACRILSADAGLCMGFIQLPGRALLEVRLNASAWQNRAAIWFPVGKVYSRTSTGSFPGKPSNLLGAEACRDPNYLGAKMLMAQSGVCVSLAG